MWATAVNVMLGRVEHLGSPESSPVHARIPVSESDHQLSRCANFLDLTRLARPDIGAVEVSDRKP